MEIYDLHRLLIPAVAVKGSICEQVLTTLVRRRVSHDSIIERHILGYSAFGIVR
jgi:hypothetical protein